MSVVAASRRWPSPADDFPALAMTVNSPDRARAGPPEMGASTK